MSNEAPVVVFDLGGVLVRICHTWQEALRVAGLDSPLLSAPPVALTDFAPFNAFQGSEATEQEYLRALAEFAGVPESSAIRIHTGILRETFPGIDGLVDELKAAGVVTGCLSNTNHAHWQALTQTDAFSVVAKLDYRAGSHELGYAKPDKRAFLSYLDRFDLRGASILYFDDSQPNVESARELGWDGRLIDPHGDPAAEIRANLCASPLAFGCGALSRA